jgi:asparagine synthase (glutamine-hydrolysing)
MSMTAQLEHRGPDDVGHWIDSEAGVALGHRRLSILDLSPEGCQPMISASGRYVIAYNGEVYNFAELRATLEKDPGISFRGHSDTEVILAAIEMWGLANAVKRFVGMFAFALWDKQERSLSLVRDRIGEKPIYYGLCRGTFLFGSELKALRAHPLFQPRVDRDSLDLLLRYDYIPAPRSIYQGIHKLIPGTILRIPAKSFEELPAPQLYWSARQVFEQAKDDPFIGGVQDALGELEALLRRAVREQMVADVPVGVLLSGGVDSSLTAALMQAQSADPVQSFTIGFEEEEVNEAVWAKAVAAHLGAKHTQLYVTPADALNVIRDLPRLYDEPYGDSSQIPTYLVARLARRDVTVCLTGDGGDELFAGYPHYFVDGLLSNRTINAVPVSCRTAAARALGALTSADRSYDLGLLGRLAPRRMVQSETGDRLVRLAKRLAALSPEATYFTSRSRWHRTSLVKGVEAPFGLLLAGPERWAALSDTRRLMMYQDLINYLPDDILVKVDRATMAVGLESRTPYLDHRVVEFAARMPLSLAIRNGEGKWLLRQLLYSYVPRQLIDRPKRGFSIPIDRWLREPLRDWAESLLDETRLRREGFFQVESVRRLWHEHSSGHRNWSTILWSILMFQAWQAHWLVSETNDANESGESHPDLYQLRRTTDCSDELVSPACTA